MFHGWNKCLDPDPNQGGGGNSSESGEGQAAGGGEGAIQLTPGQLAERLNRAKATERANLEKEYREKGILLTTEEAEQRRQAKEQEAIAAEEAKKKSGKYQELYETATKTIEAQKAEIAKLNAEIGQVKTETQRQLEAKEIEFAYADAMVDLKAKLRDDINHDHLKKILFDPGQFRIRDGKVVAVDGGGEPRISSRRENAGEFMGMRELLESTLGGLEWALKPTRSGGNGAASFSGTTVRLPQNWDTDPKVYQNLTEEQKEVARKAKGYGNQRSVGYVSPLDKK